MRAGVAPADLDGSFFSISLLSEMPKVAKLTSKNQLTLPRDVVREFPGVEYFEVRVRGEEIVLRPVTFTVVGDLVEKVRDRVAALGLTEADVDEAVRWARRRRR